MFKNNKEEIPFAHYQSIYSQLDPKEISARCELKYDENMKQFEMRYLGKDYFITFPEFSIAPKDGIIESSFITNFKPAHILFIRNLIEGSNTQSSNTFKSYRDFPWGEVYYNNFHGRCILRLTGMFGKRPEAFNKVMKDIGAIAIKESDHGYEFEFINNLYIRFLLWEGDDEFPPAMQILFSENFTLAFSAEDMAVVGDVVIGTLKQLL